MRSVHATLGNWVGFTCTPLPEHDRDGCNFVVIASSMATALVVCASRACRFGAGMRTCESMP